jgi:hypothetical protein
VIENRKNWRLLFATFLVGVSVVGCAKQELIKQNVAAARELARTDQFLV